MKEKHLHLISIAVSLLYGVFVIFLYATEPRSIEDISLKARDTLEGAVTRGQVITGTYEIDRAKFAEGVQAFRQDNFVAARAALQQADPEARDPATQFYIAYSFYRQGFGRFSNDDALFRQALEKAERVEQLDPDFRSEDPDLGLRTPDELKFELQEGLQVTADDLNPAKLFRDRK